MDSMTNSNAAPVAIIGFGVAGFNAAVALRRAGYQGQIDIFSNLDTLPYSPILTSYYAGGKATYEDCFPWSQADVDALGARIHNQAYVERLDVAGHKVRTAEGEFPYSKCLIATGASPSTVGFPSDCGYEPLVLHSMEDAEKLKAVVNDPECKRILVSGASMVALKTVEACLAGAKDITLVGMNAYVLDMNALPPAAERFERGLREKGVALRLGQTISEVEVGSDPSRGGRRILKVSFSDGGTEEFDEIAVAHGMRGNLGFVEEGSLSMDAGLLVDEFMRTSDSDVYAAGDVAQTLELVTGTPRIVGLWKNAAVQGACAGEAMAAELTGGKPDAGRAFKGSIFTNTIAVDGTLFLSAGWVDPGPEGDVRVIEDETMTVVYVYQKRDGKADPQLIGFNITSDVDEKGSVAYDTSAMLTLRILEGLRA